MDDQSNTDQVANDNQTQPEPEVSDNSSDNSAAVDSVRREATEALLPLIDTMDAPPERKFEVVMAAIRVNFNADLLRKALDAAKGIEDQAAKAEALIDVINEANYQEERA